jgi:tRNA (guanine37-N1)-methyltransferase
MSLVVVDVEADGPIPGKYSMVCFGAVVDEQVCVGPYVLTGGELPAMTVIDSVVRLIPGVLGGENSAEIESFRNGKTTREYPQYTRPEEYKGMKVPDILLSGNHAEIQKWRDANEIK